MDKLKEKCWNDEVKEKVAFVLTVAVILIPFLLLIGLVGGIEMGTINFPPSR